MATVLPRALPPMVRPETRAVTATEISIVRKFSARWSWVTITAPVACLLYTSDAADDNVE